MTGDPLRADDAPPRIRPVTADDGSALKGVIEATGLFPPAMLDDMLAGFLAGTSNEHWLTFEEGGEPVAVAYCAPEQLTRGTWNLYLIAVRPDHQGRGLGRALVRFIESLLAGTGERILLVETSGLDSFARTRAFYRGLGFVEEARIREFYDVGEDKIVFRRDLQDE